MEELQVQELFGRSGLSEEELRFDRFESGKVHPGKKTGRLPAMGWNSWNAFGSGNTEALTKQMAEKITELGLDKLGYVYVVLDDGCYRSERVDGQLENETEKFPSGFRALADFLHAKGLKFGMYNDIGTNLCAGAAVGTCGHEAEDALHYARWGIDFIKVDNCYYPWDNATFSDAENARYTFAPAIRKVKITGLGEDILLSAADGTLFGRGGSLSEEGETFVKGIGTLDGTGPENSPVGPLSSELRFTVTSAEKVTAQLSVEYATAREAGQGSWLQAGLGEGEGSRVFFDAFLPETESADAFTWSEAIPVTFEAGENILRLMNHRRQENTLGSYAALVQGFIEAAKEVPEAADIVLSICEWGKTQPHRWGYKVGDSWRILNDITFQVGADGNPGHGNWSGGYTTGVTNQYNKAVIMDEFAGLSTGWNDPDMMMIGMDGLDETMCRSHMAMWCMLNSPLMLGLDLRRVEKGDWIYNIIANESLIALNQDPLGIQAKRIFSTAAGEDCDKTYLTDNARADILAKPLADGSVALAFFNLNTEACGETLSVDASRIVDYIGSKMKNREAFEAASAFEVTDLWTGETVKQEGRVFSVNGLAPCDHVILRIRPV